MKPMPAKVNSGLLCIHHEPLHAGRALGIMAMLRWRTATPLGRPVVPDVYMMSARSPGSTGTCNALESPVRASAVDIVTARDGTADASCAAVAPRDADETMALASAWLRSASSSGGVSRVL